MREIAEIRRGHLEHYRSFTAEMDARRKLEMQETQDFNEWARLRRSSVRWMEPVVQCVAVTGMTALALAVFSQLLRLSGLTQ